MPVVVIENEHDGEWPAGPGLMTTSTGERLIWAGWVLKGTISGELGIKCTL